MKMLLEVVLSIFLHPIAMVLMWINLAVRTDIDGNRKSIWFVVSILWALGPILYLVLEEGSLW